MFQSCICGYSKQCLIMQIVYQDKKSRYSIFYGCVFSLSFSLSLSVCVCVLLLDHYFLASPCKSQEMCLVSVCTCMSIRVG